jgi:8-oxo-dGTP pyrophosphatase MutT (NUDIX family)
VPQWRSAILGDGSPLHIPRLDLASAPLELGFSAKEIRAGMPRKRKPRARKERSGRQCAALPLAVRDGEIMVMLVTSRETRRWVLPKGWAEPDLAPHELAAKEAFEEAGLVGEIEPEPIGYYSYDKRLRGGRSVSCQVSVFPMWVGRQLKHWPEQGQRETRWLTLGQAAMAVDEGDLVTLLLRLAAPAE